jgi:hypothetical protein
VATVNPELTYKPSANRATLRPNGDNWTLWVEHPDADRGDLHLVTHDEVDNSKGDHRLSDPKIVIEYVEECLKNVDYRAVRSDEPLQDPFIAVWTFAPADWLPSS